MATLLISQDGTDDGVSLCRTCMFTLVAGAFGISPELDIISNHQRQNSLPLIGKGNPSPLDLIDQGNDARPNQRPDVLGRHGGHVFRIVQPLTPDQIKKLKQSKKSKKKKNFFQRFFGTKY